MSDEAVGPDPAAPDARPASDPRAVVVLGASAGGIAALREFLTGIPPASGLAYVVVLHLSPEHDSRLAEVLQNSTALPVSQITGETRLDPDRVYVIPPNTLLTCRDGHLAPVAMTRREQRRAPIDFVLRSVADIYGPRAVAVVLSGSGSDGASGLKRVKEHGGLTVVQEPRTAEYPDMPQNARDTGLVDLVLPVSQMPRNILDYAQRLDTLDQVAAPAPVEPDSDALRDVLTLLRVRTGHDFANYKPGTVLRRIHRRMNIGRVVTLSDYARLLREQPDEPAALMKDLLISVTNFFRDMQAFEVLEQRVIPQLVSNKHGQDQVRVWSAGCATGEEAYSLAILLAERTATMLESPAIQIFATDLDDQAIAAARDGFYTDAEVADVSEQRLVRFFQRTTGGFRVKRELRELVLFAHHNVIKDPPFSHLDLVVCRNLLIYLNRTVQARLLETFHFALRPNGFLFLGSAETPDSTDLFLPADRTAHIYESRTATTRLPLGLTDSVVGHAARPHPRHVASTPPAPMLPAELHQRLLEEYAPPSVLVTAEQHQVVHVSDSAARYLRVPGGEFSRDLFQIVRPELRSDVRAALLQAERIRTAVDVRGVRVSVPDGPPSITLRVRPVLREGDPLRGYFLVLFEEERAPAGPQDVVHLVSPAAADAAQLDDELARVRAQLRATVEQYETQVEEAKAGNEELQALNEELRSSAEELETSKEELQSVNEELTTVNEELKIKIEELALTNNDFQNFINSTDIAAIFLDRQLRVKLATPRARDVFNLVPSDAGRPLSDITSRLLDDMLLDDVREVLDRLHVVEREARTKNGESYVVRVLPYRTADDRIDGVVITFLNITGRLAVDEQLRRSEERLRLLIESATDYAIFTITADGLVDSWNQGAERVFGYMAAEIVGHPVALLFTPEDRATGVPEQELATAREKGRAVDERWHLRKGNVRFYSSGVTTALGADPQLGFAKIARDLTSQRQAELLLQEAHGRLEDRVRDRTERLQAEVLQRRVAQEDVTTLLRKLVTAQEDERARIARDLHDQLGQQITALRLALGRHREQVAGTVPTTDLERALRLASEIDAAVDFLAWELRPAALDHLGLAAALPQYLHEWSAHHGIAAEFQAAGMAAGVLLPDAETTFYRVTQEALNNVVKHAHATRVDVLLEQRDGTVVLVVEDNGAGFDVADRALAARGIGLAGMRERARLVGATLDVESTPGGGTTIFLRCPADGGGPSRG